MIGKEAFANGTFACVVLSDKCASIEDRAFENCAQLRFIEIPASVTSIAATAFDGCGKELVIITTAGSEAEAFAREKGIACVLL